MKSCKMKDKQSHLFESQTTMYEWIPKFILHMKKKFNYLKTRKSMKHQEIQKILPSICQFTNSVIHQIFTIGFNYWFFGDKFCQLKKTQKLEIFAFLV
jgi:hypothetical protein